jgi:hypothetical protein
MNPFVFVNDINYGKKNLIVDDISEKAYNGYMVNRSLSYFADTVFFANEMNKYHHLDSKLQNDFLLNIVRKKRRFSKWIKPEENETIELIKQCYGYSHEKAHSVYPLLTSQNVQMLKALKGGRK